MLRRLVMGTCAQTAAALSAFADGELRGFRRSRVLRHLAACESCRAVYRWLLATIESLRSLERLEPAPRPELADDVAERLRRKSEGPAA